MQHWSQYPQYKSFQLWSHSKILKIDRTLIFLFREPLHVNKFKCSWSILFLGIHLISITGCVWFNLKIKIKIYNQWFKSRKIALPLGRARSHTNRLLKFLNKETNKKILLNYKCIKMFKYVILCLLIQRCARSRLV